MELMLFAVSLILVNELPLWFFVTALITIIHTIEESHGVIWKELKIPFAAYITFQLFVLILGGVANLDYYWLPLFVLIRVFDIGYTHLYRDLPGRISAFTLMVCDVFVLTRFYLSPQS